MSRAVQIDRDAHSLYKKAVQLAEAEKIEEAMTHLNEALNISSDFSNAICELGNCYDRIDETDKAIEHYDKAIEVDPWHADAWFNKGQTLIRRGNIEEGNKCIKKAVDLHLGR